MHKQLSTPPREKPAIDAKQVQQAFSTFIGRTSAINDPKLTNALSQLRRDLKRAKITIDN